MTARKTTKLDMHVHTRGSDGTGTPEQIRDAALKAGLDGLCITDHHHTYTAASLEVSAACREAGLMVFHGCEYSTSMGHLLIYGVEVDHFGFGFYPDTQEVINAVNAAGGRCVPAHPYKGYRRMYGDNVQFLEGVAGIEIANGQCTFQMPNANNRAKDMAAKMRTPGFGGSDAHNPRHIGLTYTRFNRVVDTYLDLIEAIDAEDFTAMISRSRVLQERQWRRPSLWKKAFGPEVVNDGWADFPQFRCDDEDSLVSWQGEIDRLKVQ